MKAAVICPQRALWLPFIIATFHQGKKSNLFYAPRRTNDAAYSLLFSATITSEKKKNYTKNEQCEQSVTFRPPLLLLLFLLLIAFYSLIIKYSIEPLHCHLSYLLCFFAHCHVDQHSKSLIIRDFFKWPFEINIKWFWRTACTTEKRYYQMRNLISVILIGHWNHTRQSIEYNIEEM